jgi:hypothetical protein
MPAGRIGLRDRIMFPGLVSVHSHLVDTEQKFELIPSREMPSLPLPNVPLLTVRSLRKPQNLNIENLGFLENVSHTIFLL